LILGDGVYLFRHGNLGTVKMRNKSTTQQRPACCYAC
jgi:hypothetical protein